MLTIGYTLINVESAHSKGKGKGILIGDKLRPLLEKIQASERELACRIGISPTAVYKWKTNKSGITWEQLQVLSEALGVSTDYFLEDKEEDEPPKKYPPTPEVVEREYIAMPIIAGVGADGEVLTDDYTLIKRSLLPRRTLYAFEVQGDSMEPTIPKDWIVLIDLEDVELRDGKVYLFARSGGLNNSLVIRRVFKESGDWMMIPDNRKYAPEKFTDERRVVGRVIKKMPKMEPMNVEYRVNLI